VVIAPADKIRSAANSSYILIHIPVFIIKLDFHSLSRYRVKQPGLSGLPTSFFQSFQERGDGSHSFESTQARQVDCLLGTRVHPGEEILQGMERMCTQYAFDGTPR
jgi:hypothetical protein